MKVIFNEGTKVKVDESYLNDEATEHADTTPTATVQYPPSDDEELVCIAYTNGTLDYVPQDILEILETMRVIQLYNADGAEAGPRYY